MDEQTRGLIEKHGVIVLPEHLEHDSYALMVEALLDYEQRDLRLYCRGDGGSTRSALAIVDLIQAHGRVTGVLAGEANSSHAIIFAGCPKRFVYPHAALGLHKVAWDGLNTRVDSTYARLLSCEYEHTERRCAEVLAAASTRTAGQWYDLIQDAGSGAIKQIFADEMIRIGMANPISEFMQSKHPHA